MSGTHVSCNFLSFSSLRFLYFLSFMSFVGFLESSELFSLQEEMFQLVRNSYRTPTLIYNTVYVCVLLDSGGTIGPFLTQVETRYRN